MCSADLGVAEICTTKINTGEGALPLLVEHDESYEAGKVLASWEGPSGDLRVAGIVTNSSVADKIRKGYLRGLSLGTSVWHDTHGQAVAKWQQELSVCSMPARKNCFMYEIDGRRLLPRDEKRQCARASAIRIRPLFSSQRHCTCNHKAPTPHSDTTMNVDSAPTDSVSDDAGSLNMQEFEKMKKDYELLKSRCNMHDTLARETLTSMQPEVEAFLSDMADGDASEAKSDLQAMVNWSKHLHTDDSIDANMRLAKTFVRCSAKYKRAREQCSVASSEKDLLANTLKENDELKVSNSRQLARLSELELVLEKTQSNCANLAKAVEEGELKRKSTNFMNLGSREVTCASSGFPDVPPPQAAGTDFPGLQDALFKLVSESGPGDSRLRPSASSHSLLGGSSLAAY